MKLGKVRVPTTSRPTTSFPARLYEANPLPPGLRSWVYIGLFPQQTVIQERLLLKKTKNKRHDLETNRILYQNIVIVNKNQRLIIFLYVNFFEF